MFTQKFIKIFHSVQEIGLFSLFQNLALGKASTNDKCHFATSWTRCRQYQCVCKILSKYSKRFKGYRHFSQTGRSQNLHKLSGDKIKCLIRLIIGHTMKVNLQFQLTFLGSCNILYNLKFCSSIEHYYITAANENRLNQLICRCLYFWHYFCFTMQQVSFSHYSYL